MKPKHLAQLLLAASAVLVIAGCFLLPPTSASLSLRFEGKTVVDTSVVVDGKSYTIPGDGVLVIPLTKPVSAVIDGIVWKKEELVLKPGDATTIDLIPEESPRAWIVRYRSNDGTKSDLVITRPASVQAIEIDLESPIATFTTIEATYTLFSNGKFVGWARLSTSASDAAILDLQLPSNVSPHPLGVMVVGIQGGKPVVLFDHRSN